MNQRKVLRRADGRGEERGEVGKCEEFMDLIGKLTSSFDGNGMESLELLKVLSESHFCVPSHPQPPTIQRKSYQRLNEFISKRVDHSSEEPGR
jgi:hypothetical protein